MCTAEPWVIFPFFNDVARKWGARLWSFLNEEDSVGRMIQASDDEEPAAKAIAAELYRRFGDDVKQDRVKQYTGLLIRRVMEVNGYQHLSKNRPCGDNPVFSVASLYGCTQ